jgi:hypothetical protein
MKEDRLSLWEITTIFARGNCFEHLVGQAGRFVTGIGTTTREGIVFQNLSLNV